MKSRVRVLAFGAAAVGVVCLGVGATWAQDAKAVIDQRQDTMKAQGRALAAVRAFTEDKGDLAAARAGGADLVRLTNNLPSLFPQRTGMAEYPGTSYAKPDVWAQWEKFNEAATTAHQRALALNTALQGGDKAAITAALQAMSQQGCGGCHTPFRERKT
jgi:cytochrome c556